MSRPEGSGIRSEVRTRAIYQTKGNSWLQKFILYGGIPSYLEDRCDELDRMAARYVFDYPFHAVRHKNLHDLVQSLKSRSDNDFDTFATLIYNVDGAYTTREPRGPVVQLACPLITNANSSTIKPDRNSVALTR